MSWSEDRIADLKKQWLEGQSATQIARALGDGVTRSAILGKVRRLGLPMRQAHGQSRKVITGDQVRVLRQPKAPSLAAKAPTLTLVHDADAPTTQVGLKTLAERGPRDCCWPIGAPDPRQGQLFCGLPATKGGRFGGYCSGHSPNQPSALREVRFKDEMTRRPRPAREDADIDLTELLA